jgi:hypothetical protein
MTAIWTTAAVLASLPSCQHPTEITVVVTTDLDCSMLKGTSIAVGSPDSLASALPSSTALTCNGGNIGTLVVVPSTSGDPELAIRVVTGVNESPDACDKDGYTGGCIVARRALHFIAHTPLTVPIVMRQDCENIPCNAAGQLKTCVKGQCVPAAIPDPTFCEGSGCGEETLSRAGDAGQLGDAEQRTPDGTAPTCGSGGPTDVGHLPWLPCILNTVPSTVYLTVSGFNTCRCFNGTFALTQDPAPNGNLWTSHAINGCPGQTTPAYFKFEHMGVDTTSGLDGEAVGITDISSTLGSATNNDESFADDGTCSPLWFTGSGTTISRNFNVFCSASEDKNMSWTLSDSPDASAPPPPPTVDTIPASLKLTVSGFKKCTCFNDSFTLAKVPDQQDPTGSLWTSQPINGCPGQQTTAYLKFKVGTANGFVVGAAITDRVSEPGIGNNALSLPNGGTWCPLSVTGGPPMSANSVVPFCSYSEVDMAWTLTE